ncbi:MAG: hydroxymethylglutaryl-CoA reductase [Kiritimatiellae bacterium]|nr:hydroxymethylglutaryl-CoA reductase [Kiritimatiellia bacterium]
MPAPRKIAGDILKQLLAGGNAGDEVHRLAPRPPDKDPLPPHVPHGNDHTATGLEKRRAFLKEQGLRIDNLSGLIPDPAPESLAGHVENFVGYAKVPVGVIGPLRVNGAHAHGDFFVPLATSEGALVASYNRGAYVISQSGGAAAMCLTESVSRSPCFAFRSLADAGLFLAWALPRFESFQKIVATTSGHARLLDLRTVMLGKELYLILDFTTGDASGQNMVTLAADALARRLVAESPVKPEHWYVEGNLSGDKKATMLSFLFARGKKVVAEAVIRRDLLKKVIHVTVDEMLAGWQVSVLGGIQSGAIGAQGHFANALAALFIACGQDAACVAEASVGLTRMDKTADGDLYVSISLPNLIVGTVGGGTTLPGAREGLAMLGCAGEGGARKFAEICAATALAGEISLTGAIIAGEFSQAHARYGRKRKAEKPHAG